MNIVSRFLSKIRIEGECWIWTGYISNPGYGRIGFKGKPRDAHRISYQLFNGKIPKGKWVLHSCDIRACVNPEHLWIGDVIENTKDKIRKGRQHRPNHHGDRNPKAKLTNSEVLRIRKDTRILDKIAKEYGVSINCIWRIRKRISWSLLKENTWIGQKEKSEKALGSF